MIGRNGLGSVSSFPFGGCKFEVMEKIEGDSGFLSKGFPEVFGGVGRRG